MIGAEFGERLFYICIGEYRAADFSYFAKYLKARYEEKIEELLFREYVSRSISLVGQGSHIVKPYIDIVRSKGKEEEEPEKTGDEIAEEIMKKGGLSFGCI